jgi:hypothetical protein
VISPASNLDMTTSNAFCGEALTLMEKLNLKIFFGKQLILKREDRFRTINDPPKVR